MTLFILVLTGFLNSYANIEDWSELSAQERAVILKRACDEGKGQISNCFQLGLLYERQGVPDKATQYMTMACKGNPDFQKAGDVNACRYLKRGVTGSETDILLYAGLFLVVVSVFLITSMIFQDEDTFKAQEKLEDEKVSKEEVASQGIVLQYSRPFFRRYVTPIVQSMKNKKKIKEKYKRPLAAAGLTQHLTPEDFYAFKLFLIIGFPIVFLGVRQFLEETWDLKLSFVMGAVGYIYPDIWIKGKIQQRQKEIMQNMPFAVDMLALSVEAGLDFMAAMTKVIEKAKKSALTEEFEILIKETKVGASRAEGLRNLAWRVDLITISSFCATLIAADSVGASIGPILKNLSAEIRQKKSADAEKAGATAATKILFPMLFLIVPAVFLIVAAPVMLEAFMGGG